MPDKTSIKSIIKALLPLADETVVDSLTEKVEQELRQKNSDSKKDRPNDSNALVERIIKQEELTLLLK